jgi:hypothetical protein
MAHGMSRSHRLILRLIMGVAAGTFLFAIWAFIDRGKSRSTTNLPPTGEPNEPPGFSQMIWPAQRRC